MTSVPASTSSAEIDWSNCAAWNMPATTEQARCAFASTAAFSPSRRVRIFRPASIRLRRRERMVGRGVSAAAMRRAGFALCGMSAGEPVSTRQGTRNMRRRVAQAAATPSRGSMSMTATTGRMAGIDWSPRTLRQGRIVVMARASSLTRSGRSDTMRTDFSCVTIRSTSDRRGLDSCPRQRAPATSTVSNPYKLFLSTGRLNGS